MYWGATRRFVSSSHSVAIASLPTAASREHNVAVELDATCTTDIVEWTLVDESRMPRTDGELVSPNDAIVAPSASLRRFIEVVPGSNGRHFANEIAIDIASPDWVFFKSQGVSAGSWRRGSWNLTYTCVTLTFASRPGVHAKTRSYYRNGYGCFAIADHTTAAHCKFLLPQSQ